MGRAKPIRKDNTDLRARSLEFSVTVKSLGGNAQGQVGILMNRERELGLDRRETG